MAEALLARLRAATAGEFEVHEEIGRGGMARVYLAHELVLDRQVALKVLSPLFSEHAEIVRRFQHEARMAGQLSHPNIVPVFAVYQRGGLSFFSMPYIAGVSFRGILRERGALDVDEALGFVLQAAAGLGYAHDRGVVHRDVKPENMLLEEPHGRLALSDFGLAKALGGESLTLPGDMIGTPHYMSPEQCEGRTEVDGRSDQYSLALVAYEMLTGSHPFGDVSFRELIFKQLSENPPPLQEIRPDIPPKVARAIARALSKDLSDRFPSIYSFTAALTGDEQAIEVTVPAEGSEENGQELEAQTLWMRESLRRSHRRQRLWSRLRGLKRFGLQEVSVAAVAATLTIVIASAAVWQGGFFGVLSEGSAAAVTSLSFRDVDPSTSASLKDFVGPPPKVDEPLDEESPAAGEDQDRAAVDEPPSQSGSNVQSAGPADQPPAEPPQEAELSSTRQPDEPADLGSVGSVDEAEDRSATDLAVDGSEGSGNDEAAGPSLDQFPVDEPADKPADVPDTAGAETPELSPAEALQDLLERYRVAFENEDLDRLRDEIYRGEIPKRDQETLGMIFSRAEDLEVVLKIPDLDVDGDRVTYKIEHRMRFRLARTGRTQNPRIKFSMTFERGADGWRLVELKN